MFWNNFELKTPSPNRLDERNSRKVLHSPWTAQRMKKKGRNAKLSPTTDGPVYDIHRDLNCESKFLWSIRTGLGLSGGNAGLRSPIGRTRTKHFRCYENYWFSVLVLHCFG